MNDEELLERQRFVEVIYKLADMLKVALHTRDSYAQVVMTLPDWREQYLKQLEDPFRMKHTHDTLIAPLYEVLEIVTAGGDDSEQRLDAIRARLRALPN